MNEAELEEANEKEETPKESIIDSCNLQRAEGGNFYLSPQLSSASPFSLSNLASFKL